jgi:hypothetical protein
MASPMPVVSSLRTQKTAVISGTLVRAWPTRGRGGEAVADVVADRPYGRAPTPTTTAGLILGGAGIRLRDDALRPQAQPGAGSG